MAEKKSVPAPVVAAVSVLALALILFFGFRTLAGPSYPEVPTSVELHSQAEKLSLKCAGDFDKLAPDEQKMLDNMTRGHGRQYVRDHYAKLAPKGGNPN